MVLAVDISASSAFGSLRRTKREFAAEIAGTLAFSAARSSDKVALLLFTDQVELYLPPRKGRRHVLRLLRELLTFEPRHRSTNIPAALAFLNHVVHRRSIVFLLTDFLHSFETTTGTGHTGAVASQKKSTESSRAKGQGRDTLKEIGLTNVRHDLVCLHLHDHLEIALPSAGLLTVEDSETGELIEMDSTRNVVREKFARANAERLAALDGAFRRAGIDTLRFSTAETFAQELQRFFETRRGRRRG
jgi:uncharacterized protein (DUF58 family)